ncbi:MAG: hypothetical protein OXF08_08570 [Bacteroidetes bacterium]|nr:hypothetical protein [Bacteroidota bacterium]
MHSLHQLHIIKNWWYPSIRSIPPTWGERLGNVFSNDQWGYTVYQHAMAGDPNGLFYLGMCFETGMGLARSGEAKLGHYEKALKLGYPGTREAVERCK